MGPDSPVNVFTEEAKQQTDTLIANMYNGGEVPSYEVLMQQSILNSLMGSMQSFIGCEVCNDYICVS